MRILGFKHIVSNILLVIQKKGYYIVLKKEFVDYQVLSRL